VLYLAYLRRELLRRRARTILGLARGVALVIEISSLSRGLDDAQETALDPLTSIGTDLTVTRTPDESAGQVFFEGRDLGTLRDHELAGLRLRAFGFVFQQLNLIPTLTPPRTSRRRWRRCGCRGLRGRAHALLAEVGLADRATHLPLHLSGASSSASRSHARSCPSRA
jgi:hypothetical protein